ncbi:4a-hydroxytetrahydrobiopterin dehydratase [Halobaculum sp. CBA1158]|uniref:4a-hydroxytetrahydrobiopterin dehydratase n=1 Tax=Halobaculum sp. CBA1158 TaxID=2904243 RepID=UPI001F318E78|nr:4a-hydroxytetrahydrobiopterin dehydratase [Halobaculum sp. CBA1158]UIO99511.1 4a-hydroxytetrahydrobiopterin dehydratase [Halobaculum sp. CBA1158]
MTDVLDADEIEAECPDGWHHDAETDEIARTFEFDSYLEGVGFAAGAGGIAEEAFHHPTITIGWREVEVRLTTHDAGGITEKDIDLAGRLNELAD